MNCQYCKREAKTLVSNVQHEIWCKENPNRKIRKGTPGQIGRKRPPGFVTTNQWSKPGYTMSAETRKKISEATKKANETRWSDPEIRKKHAESMRRAVDNNPESYTSSNRGRVKQIEYKGIKFQGSWELEFYKYCEFNSIECVRNTEGFKYVWQGERTYYPDFYLPKYDTYVEVKGYKTERDEAKWKQFPKKLLIIDKKDIDNIKKDIYNLIIVK
jgi:hypothetical protein